VPPTASIVDSPRVRHTSVLRVGVSPSHPAQSAATPPQSNVTTLDSFALRLEVTANPYSYRVIEKSTREILLAQDNTALTVDAEFYPVTDAVNIARPDARTLTADLNLELAGRDPLPPNAPHQAQVKFTFVNPEELQITISFIYPGVVGGIIPPLPQISEQFSDQGEHYYGVWEYPFGGNLDDRGADHDFLGLGNERYVHHSSARAPFYLTSRKYGVYVESQAPGHFAFAQAGETSFTFRTDQLTYDIFYGPTYADIFRRYNAVAGPPVLPPTWAFGSIWWRDDEHDDLRRAANAQEKVLDDADHLRALHIPAGAIWLDRPYGAGPDGWGSFDFDAGFPDPQKLIHDVNDRGMQLLLWISDNATGTLDKEGSARGFLLPPTGSAHRAVDVTNPEAYEWFKNLLDAYVSLGIKGYKIDRGDEGEIPDAAQNEIATLFPKLAAESLEARYGDDFFMFARNANDTARRYTAVWNGDTWSSFAGLQMAVKNALRAGAIDFPIWGSDTGGYFLPADKDLEARWLEFSAYSPLMEVIIGPKRTIWDDYDDEVVAIAREAATTHADLIPYVRSHVYSARASGLPVMRALEFAFPNDPAVTDMTDEYLYGENLLVAPILEEGATSRKVYFPGAPVGQAFLPVHSSQPPSTAIPNENAQKTGKGTTATLWLREGSDLRTVYRGGTTVTIPAPLNVIPVFVREGAIIPKGDIVRLNNNWSSPPPVGQALLPVHPSPESAPTPVETGQAPQPAAQIPPSAVGAELASARPPLSPRASPPQSAPAAVTPPDATPTPNLAAEGNWYPTLHIQIYPGRNPSAFSYYTGAVAATITVAPAPPDSTSPRSGFKIVVGDLDATGTLEIFCRATPASLTLTRNGVPLFRGHDYQYDPKSQKLTVPVDGPITLDVRGAASLFN